MQVFESMLLVSMGNRDKSIHAVCRELILVVQPLTILTAGSPKDHPIEIRKIIWTIHLHLWLQNANLPVSIAGLLATKTQELVVHHCSTWTEIPRSSISASSTCFSRYETYTLPKTNISLPKKENFIFQPSIFRSQLAVRFRECTCCGCRSCVQKFWVLLVAELLAVKICIFSM